MTSRFIPIHDRGAWIEVLLRCGGFDVYHLPEYQLAPTPMDTGKAVLAVAEDEATGFVAALPLRLRPVNEVDDIRASGEFGDEVVDAISPYGYPGLIMGGEPPYLPGAGRSFRRELEGLLRANGVVAAFIRQNPLFETTRWFVEQSKKPGDRRSTPTMEDPAFEVRSPGQTVAIDLTLGEDAYRRETRASHRARIAQWNDRAAVFEEPGRTGLAAFAEMYAATMERKEASARYRFDRGYFEALTDALGDRCRVFIGRFGNAGGADIAAGAIILTCGEIAQYHLAATTDPAARSGLSRWLLEQIRIQLAAEGLSTLHLGGGVGAERDSLYEFKSGFSKWRPRFHVVTWIGNKSTYERLCALTGAPFDTQFFPRYRC